MLVNLKLFIIFFKVGIFSFGGGYAMLPMIYKELETFNLTSREFSDIVAISQMTPGPIAVNAATFVGFNTAGFWGSVFATAGVSMPSFLIILAIAAFLDKFKSNKVVQSILMGIRPITVGMIASAVIFFANTSIINPSAFGPDILKNITGLISIPALSIFVLTIIGDRFLKIGPIALTMIAGVLGAFIL